MRFKSRKSIVPLLILLVGLIVLLACSLSLSNTRPSTPPPATSTLPQSASTQPANSSPNPKPSGNRNLQLGNPSGAVHDSSQPTNYLIERPEYVLSYHRDHGIPNWVSWQLTQQDLGDVERSDNFVPDTSLPAGWYQVKPDDYSGSGYDRGHICPSADRTDTKKANEATFIMTNMVPQAPDNNRVTWEHLESYSRDLVTKGHVLYIIAGGDGSNGTIAKGKVLVPGYTWKIIVVMPKGDSDVSHITADTPVIAVRVPNGLKDKLDDWDKYRVTVASIEEATGYDFFTNLAPNIQHALKSQAGMSSSEPVIETPLSTPTPKPSNSEAVCECGSNHYDCSDFETHKSAQACYEHCISLGRGDIHQLDGNNDGSVCESLP